MTATIHQFPAVPIVRRPRCCRCLRPLVRTGAATDPELVTAGLVQCEACARAAVRVQVRREQAAARPAKPPRSRAALALMRALASGETDALEQPDENGAQGR